MSIERELGAAVRPLRRGCGALCGVGRGVVRRVGIAAQAGELDIPMDAVRRSAVSLRALNYEGHDCIRRSSVCGLARCSVPWLRY